MPTFIASTARGRISHLLLQDPDVFDKDGKLVEPTRIWAQSADGVLELDGPDAARFREVAGDYGYSEVKTEAKKTAAKSEPTDG